MGSIVHVALAAVVATSEFCADPIEGGVGDPQFCRITSMQEISTPFLSVVVEPGFLVGVQDQGRRIQIQSTLWQAMDVMTIVVVGDSRLPASSACTYVTETVEEHVTWHDCRSTQEGFHSRHLVARLKGHHVVIDYSYGPLGASSAPALERMTQSIRIQVN